VSLSSLRESKEESKSGGALMWLELNSAQTSARKGSRHGDDQDDDDDRELKSKRLTETDLSLAAAVQTAWAPQAVVVAVKKLWCSWGVTRTGAHGVGSGSGSGNGGVSGAAAESMSSRRRRLSSIISQQGKRESRRRIREFRVSQRQSTLAARKSLLAEDTSSSTSTSTAGGGGGGAAPAASGGSRVGGGGGAGAGGPASPRKFAGLQLPPAGDESALAQGIAAAERQRQRQQSEAELIEQVAAESVLRDVEFDARRGSVTGVMGPVGSGAWV
jgi:hypothetical protein